MAGKIIQVLTLALACNLAWSADNADKCAAAAQEKKVNPKCMVKVDTPDFKFEGEVTKDFDLSKSPKDWFKTQPIINALLELGEKHIYKEAGKDKLPLWVFRPEGMRKDELKPCVMFIHGGSWGGNAPMFAPQCLYLSRIGIIGVTVEFRCYNDKAGISPKTCLADCLSAYRWLRKNGKELGIDTDKILLSGESAGGHLSLSMLTLEGYADPSDDKSIPIDPKALILFDPAIDLVDGWKGGQERLKPFNIAPETFSPAHHVRPGMPETLVISGSLDGVIPPDLIRAFVKRMEEKGNKAAFIEYPGMGHAVFNYGFTGVGSEYFLKGMKHVEDFLQKIGYLPSK